MPPEVTPGEMLLRFVVAVIFTFAATLLIVALARMHGRPWPERPLYAYLLGVVLLMTIWRWIIAILGLLDAREVAEISWFVAYVNPINQALLGLLGFALVLHGIVMLRRIH